MLEKYQVTRRQARVDSKLEADTWFVPGLVLEVTGSEITLSPIHTCGMNVVRAGAGLAIRFPRFTGRYREDKSAEQATTTKEIIGMYQSQLKKLSGIQCQTRRSPSVIGLARRFQWFQRHPNLWLVPIGKFPLRVVDSEWNRAKAARGTEKYRGRTSVILRQSRSPGASIDVYLLDAI